MANNPDILIIEDEAYLAELYQIKFKHEGLDARLALDGEQGLQAIADKRPDLVLLDIIMPGINGYEVLRRLKAEETTRTIPVVVFSNLGQEEEIRKGIALGAEDYIVKANYTPNDVVRKVERLLEQVVKER